MYSACSAGRFVFRLFETFSVQVKRLWSYYWVFPLMKRFLSICSVVAALFSGDPVYAASYDVVIYGGTSAAVTAAVQAKRAGLSVVVVSPDNHLGGLSSGGLGWTDTGNKAVIGGLAREFYHRVWKHYDQDYAWRFQEKSSYGNKGQGNAAIDGVNRTMWIFEPSVAEAVFDGFVKEYDIPVHRDEWLDRKNGVKMKNGKIRSITTLSGKTFQGKIFMDTTYEGDLMATAGVSYHVGRESIDTYDEEWNGVQVGVLHHGHWFKTPVSPYKVPGDPSSGLLPRISGEHPGVKGEGDHRVQAYCFRMCLTDHPENRVPFPKPEGYDPDQYELLLRVLATGWREGFRKFDPIPNRKTDTNNHGPFSTDNIGMNYDYPDASYERRQEIIREHETFQMGLMYFLANDPRVPDDVREKFSQWGLAKDEFKDNGNWSHQLYIREARRMIGEHVMTEHDCLKTRPTPKPIGMGSYTIDSHNVQRYVTPEGYVQNEGDIGVSTKGPYQISYQSLTPKKSECKNLLVPVCVSSSHMAFGSIRMEPVFMILGHSAATAAAIAIEKGQAVQDVDYDELKARLIKDGQVLDYNGPIKQSKGISLKTQPGVTLDDSKLHQVHPWTSSTSSKDYFERGYLHDGNTDKGRSDLVFKLHAPAAGEYEVRFAYPEHGNRATNTPVTVRSSNGESTVKVNQKKAPGIDGAWHFLGRVQASKGEEIQVIISTKGTDGYVVADAVQLLPLK